MNNKKELTLMQEFNLAVFKSVQYKNGLNNIGDYKFYYPKEYGDRINAFLESKNVVSKETDKGSLMSASSSARLCTNYFYENSDQKTFEFEKALYNDVSNVPTKMDASDGLVFYECKCQEIVNGEHELLRKSYYTKKSSKLFKEFGITNIEIKPHKNKYGRKDYEYCDFSLNDLDICYPGKYYDINFNVKQLICHLIAIAKQTDNSKQKELRYVIFKPSESLIKESDALKGLYESLDEQFEAILKSRKIQNFCSAENHNIKLSLEYVYIDKVTEHFEKG